MKTHKIGILTEARWIAPDALDDYAKNVLLEDQLLLEALTQKQVVIERIAWDNPTCDWSSFDLIIFRAIWDYFHRYTEFDAWLKKLPSNLIVVNDLETVHWNIDKHYLLDVERLGVPIIPTLFVEIQEERSLEELIKETTWKEVIIKPVVSAGAKDTYRVLRENIHELQPIFTKLIQGEAMILQEFQKYILTEGEVSHMLFDGRYSHSILKLAKDGDFRVQDDFGGTVHAYEASKKEIEIAEKALQSAPNSTAYARVDMLKNNAGNWCVGELELIEPELWFRFKPESAEVLAKAIHNKLLS